MGAVSELPVPETGRVAALPNQSPAAMSPEALDAEAFRATAGSFRRGLRSSVTGLGGAIEASLGGAADALGLTGFANERFKEAEQYTQQADAVGPRVKDYREVKDLQDAADYVAGAAGQAVGSIAPIAAGGMVKGLRGAAAGAFVPEFGQQIMRTRGSPASPQARAGVAAAEAGANTALGLAVPVWGLRQVQRAAAGGQVAQAASTTAKAAAGMGASTVAQEAVRQGAHSAVDPARDTHEDAPELVNAGLSGAVGGAMLGAGAAGAARLSTPAGSLAKARKSIAEKLERRSDTSSDRATTADEAKSAMGSRERPPPLDPDISTLPEDPGAMGDAVDAHDAKVDAHLKREWDRVKGQEQFKKFEGWEQDPEKRDSLHEALGGSHADEVDKPFLRRAVDKLKGYVDGLRPPAEKGAPKASERRTAMDVYVLDEVTKHLPEHYREALTPAERIELAEAVKSYALHTAGVKDELPGPGAPQELHGSAQDMREVMLGKPTLEEGKRPQARVVPHALMDLFGENLWPLVNSVQKGLRSGGLKLDKALSKKDIGAAEKGRAATTTALENVVLEHLRSDLLPDPEARGHVVREMTRKLTRAVNEGVDDWKTLDRELDFAFGKNKDTVLQEFDAERERLTRTYEDIGSAAEPRTDESVAQKLSHNERFRVSEEDEGGAVRQVSEAEPNPTGEQATPAEEAHPYRDKRIGVAMDLESVRQTIRGMREEPGFSKKDVHLKPEPEVNEKGELTGRFKIVAEDAAAPVGFDAEALKNIHETQGKAGHENSVISVVRKDAENPGRNKTLAVSIPRLVGETMATTKSRGEGAAYVHEMLMEGLGRLVSDPDFVRFAPKSEKEGWNFPKDMLVAIMKNKDTGEPVRYTWGDVQKARGEEQRNAQREYWTGVVKELAEKVKEAKESGELIKGSMYDKFLRLRKAAARGTEGAKEAYNKLVRDYARGKEEAKSGFYMDEQEKNKGMIDTEELREALEKDLAQRERHYEDDTGLTVGQEKRGTNEANAKIEGTEWRKYTDLAAEELEKRDPNTVYEWKRADGTTAMGTVAEMNETRANGLISHSFRIPVKEQRPGIGPDTVRDAKLRRGQGNDEPQYSLRDGQSEKLVKQINAGGKDFAELRARIEKSTNVEALNDTLEFLNDTKKLEEANGGLELGDKMFDRVDFLKNDIDARLYDLDKLKGLDASKVDDATPVWAAVNDKGDVVGVYKDHGYAAKKAEEIGGTAVNDLMKNLRGKVKMPDSLPDFTEMRVGKERITPEQEAQVKTEVERLLGPKASVEFLDKMKGAGQFANLSGVETLRVSTQALDPLGVGRHEAFHGIFARLSDTNPEAANVLSNAARSPNVIARLKELLKDEPAALRQLDSAEERAAYMYEFWAADQLKVGPKTETLFQKVRAMMGRAVYALFGVGEDRATAGKAEQLLRAFHDGKLAERSAAGRVISELLPRDELQDTWSKRLGDLANRVLSTADGYIRDQKLPAFTDAADGWFNPGEGKPGVLQARHTAFHRYMNEYSVATKGLDAAAERRVLESLQQQKDLTTNAAEASAVRATRRILDDVWDYMDKKGVREVVWDSDAKQYVEHKMGQQENYFPRSFDSEAIAAKRAEFVKMLDRNGIAGAEKVADKLANPGKAPTKDEPGVTFYEPHTMARKLKIPESELAPFMKKDLGSIMYDYLHYATRRGEYAERFGNQGQGIEMAVREGVKQGATPEQVRSFEKYVHAMDGTLGNKLDPALRRLMGGVMTYQNFRLLPLALFSSLVDPLGIVVRGAPVQDGFKAFGRGVRELFKNVEDKDRDFARAVGAIVDASEEHMVADMYGQNYGSAWQKWLNQKLFKMNGMESWNNSMRTVAAGAARDFIAKHATEQGEHSARWLRELGLEAKDVRVDKDGAPELTPQVVDAVNRWVDGAVLRPHAAIRPIWSSDPRFMLISHLKQFSYAFQKTIVERALHEAGHGNMRPMAAVASYVPLIIASDMLRALVTPGGGDDKRWEKWGLTDWLMHGVSRAGITGPGQYALDGAMDLRHGKLALSSIGGPTIQQLSDLTYAAAGAPGSDLKTEALRALPFVPALFPGKIKLGE